MLTTQILDILREWQAAKTDVDESRPDFTRPQMQRLRQAEDALLSIPVPPAAVCPAVWRMPDGSWLQCQSDHGDGNKWRHEAITDRGLLTWRA